MRTHGTSVIISKHSLIKGLVEREDVRKIPIFSACIGAFCHAHDISLLWQYLWNSFVVVGLRNQNFRFCRVIPMLKRQNMLPLEPEEPREVTGEYAWG